MKYLEVIYVFLFGQDFVIFVWAVTNYGPPTKTSTAHRLKCASRERKLYFLFVLSFVGGFGEVKERSVNVYIFRNSYHFCKNENPCLCTTAWLSIMFSLVTWAEDAQILVNTRFNHMTCFIGYCWNMHKGNIWLRRHYLFGKLILTIVRVLPLMMRVKMICTHGTWLQENWSNYCPRPLNVGIGEKWMFYYGIWSFKLPSTPSMNDTGKWLSYLTSEYVDCWLQRVILDKLVQYSSSLWIVDSTTFKCSPTRYLSCLFWGGV